MHEDTITPFEIGINFATTCACFNLRKAARAVTSLYDGVLQPTGLRSTQATLLMAIASAGTATISQLAEVLVMDRTTLARNLKLLEARRLISIKPGQDQRTRVVHVTELGRQALLRALPLWEQAQRQVTAALGARQLDQLFGSLDALEDLSQTPSA